MAAESDNPSQIIRVSECKWEPMSATIKLKTLWSDPASKRRAQLTRFEPGQCCRCIGTSAMNFCT